MANYTNLTYVNSSYINVGDTITYTEDKRIEHSGYLLKVQLYGKYCEHFGDNPAESYFYNGLGGYVEFVIDTSLLPSKSLSFSSRGDLIYGNYRNYTDEGQLYYRIAVAGDGGETGRRRESSMLGDGRGGAGGGSTGESGSNYGYDGLSDSNSLRVAKGGTQTSGGQSSVADVGSEYSGSFGKGGLGYGSGGQALAGAGGYGWFGGGGGYTNGSLHLNTQINKAKGGAGGSGFLLGVSRSTGPTNYLGGDSTLRKTIINSISEGKLVQGGSSFTAPRMVITILSKNSKNTIKYYNGTNFVDTTVKYYNGSSFEDCKVYYYDGSTFKEIGG